MNQPTEKIILLGIIGEKMSPNCVFDHMWCRCNLDLWPLTPKFIRFIIVPKMIMMMMMMMCN